MKANMKKFACLILALMLVLAMLTGCGSQESASQSDTAEKSETPAAAESVSSAEPSAEEPTESGEDEDKIVFPLEEPVDLTIATSVAPFAGQYISEITDFTLFREMETRTNVIFEGIMLPAASTAESINTIIAGGDYPDVFPWLDSFSSTGSLQNYMDGVIIDLSEYIDKYAPNLQASLVPEVELEMSFEVDGGEVVLGFPCMNKEAITSNITGFQYRADWLEEAGLSVPTTLSEFTEVVKAFKVNHDATLFIGAEATGIPISTALDIYCDNGQFNGLVSPVMNKDGTVVSGLLEDNFYTYLQIAHEWYKEGYIDPDFMSGETTADNAIGEITNGEIGIYQAGISSFSSVNSVFAEEGNGASMVAGTIILADDAEDTHVDEPKSYSRCVQWSISSSCEYPEIVTAWVDYLFSDEGYILFNYGVEGEGLQYNENGEPELTDLVLQNPNGDPVICTEYVYCVNEASCLPGILDMDKNLRLYSDDVLEAYQMWKTQRGGSDWRIPKSVKLDVDQTEIANSYVGDLTTYYDEMILRFVIEDGLLTEESFNEFRERLVELGINEIVAVYQDAVETYEQRLAALS